MDQARLRDVVGPHEGTRTDARYGCDVHDRPSVFTHPGMKSRPNPQERGSQIHRPGLVEGAEVDIGQHSGRRVRSSVVDEDVARTEPLDRGSHRLLGRFFGIGAGVEREHGPLVYSLVDEFHHCLL